MRRKIVIGTMLVAMIGLFPSVAMAGNPSGSGQPGAECGDEGATTEPAGFTSGGFEIAESNYAGSDGTHSLVSGNDSAVSQYDVACYQVTQHH